MGASAFYYSLYWKSLHVFVCQKLMRGNGDLHGAEHHNTYSTISSAHDYLSRLFGAGG